MLQPDFLCEILKKCRGNGIHTAGYEALNMAHEKYYAPDNIEKFKEMFGGEKKILKEATYN